MGRAASAVAAARRSDAGKAPGAPAGGKRGKATTSKGKAPLRHVSSEAQASELRAKALKIERQLRELFPAPPIPLEHRDAFQLLCAVMLSAQSTDKKVNEVTPELFRRFGTAAKMSAAAVEEVQHIIRQVGLAPTKAKNLVKMATMLQEQYEGQVPDSMEELEKLPGVGHKTAGVVMIQAFDGVAFPVDTHIHRLAARWGLSDGSSVEQVEADLKELFPQHTWKALHLQIIYYGREYGKAQQVYPFDGPICSWAGLKDPPQTTPAGKKKFAGGAPTRVEGGKEGKSAKRKLTMAPADSDQPAGSSHTAARVKKEAPPRDPAPPPRRSTRRRAQR